MMMMPNDGWTSTEEVGFAVISTVPKGQHSHKIASLASLYLVVLSASYVVLRQKCSVTELVVISNNIYFLLAYI